MVLLRRYGNVCTLACGVISLPLDQRSRGSALALSMQPWRGIRALEVMSLLLRRRQRANVHRVRSIGAVGMRDRARLALPI